MLDRPSSRDDVLQFLLLRINYEHTRTIPYHPDGLKLSRMRRLLRDLGDPHRRLTIAHIAGSKGKGSTACMLSRIVSEAGYRTGLYTSPHLERIEERFALQGVPCATEQLIRVVGDITAAVQRMDAEGNGPTYFEICTAVAFLMFYQQQVDLAVIEVGMGGRLDSTNVCDPLLTLITSISLDHTQQLGTTLPAIAREKAGIIKPGVPVISGVEDAGAVAAIMDVARDRGSTVRQLGVDYAWRRSQDGHLHVQLLGTERADCAWNDLEIGMLGAHQAANAALVVVAVDELRSCGFTISDTALRKGLRETQCPARIERLAQRPTILLDAAHNVASISALTEVLQSQFSAKKSWLIFAASHGKDVRGMLERLMRSFDQIILTEYQSNPRSVPLSELQALAESCRRANHAIVTCSNPNAAWEYVSARVDPDDLVCITGSFFLAAELRPLLREASLPCVSGPH